MKIGLLSDTHGFIDEQILGYLKDCEEVWHAGDVGSPEVIEQLQGLNKRVRVVYGNIDEGPGRNPAWPECDVFKVDSCKVMMLHIVGKPPRYNPRSRRLIQMYRPNLLIAGHSHILSVQYDHTQNLLFINPGACGHHGFHKIRTLILFEINQGKPENLRVVELGLRGRK